MMDDRYDDIQPITFGELLEMFAFGLLFLVMFAALVGILAFGPTEVPR